MDRATFARWIGAYEEAWRTPGTDGLAALFSEDARYAMAPFEPPYEGIDAIADMWEAEREGHDEVFVMTSELVAVEGHTAVARLDVRYGDPVTQRYLDLWVIRLGDDGRCVDFEEWPFWPDK